LSPRRIVFVLLLFVVSSCAPVVGNDRVALIIGNGAYRGDIPRLTNPERDAKALAAMTQKLGYRSLLVLDGNREEMRQALNAFVATAKTADMALVFYSGHGFEVNGQNMLLPVDFQLTGQDTTEDRAFPLAELDAAFSSIKGTTLLFIDACRDDPFKAVIDSPRTAVLQSRGGVVPLRHTKGLAQQDARYATAMMYATEPGNVALDGTGETSPFATAIVENLSRSRELRRFLGDVQLSVSVQTNGAQVPSWNTRYILPATPLYNSKRYQNDTASSPLRMVTAAHPAARGTVSTVSETLFSGINVTTTDPVAQSDPGCRTETTRDYFLAGAGQMHVRMEMRNRATPCTVQFYNAKFAWRPADEVKIPREPRHGTVTVLGSAVGYVPEAGFIGTDSFELDLSFPRRLRHAIVNVTVR
jgi:hypothetical protein